MRIKINEAFKDFKFYKKRIKWPSLKQKEGQKGKSRKHMKQQSQQQLYNIYLLSSMYAYS